MKEVLEKHVLSILSTLKIKESFEIYDCRIGLLPDWVKQIQITHEYLILIKELTDGKILQKFLQREVYKNEYGIYWFDGDRIIDNSQEINIEADNLSNTPEIVIDYLKTETRLPKWLDDYIFDDLKAEYAPDFNRFEKNLDLTENENLKYLGTYFPRSYAESFCIFDNIFQNNLKNKGKSNVYQEFTLHLL